MIVFIDDILVYLSNKNDHMGNLRVMLHVLKENQLFAKYRKCEFWLRSVALLGHVIYRGGVEVDPRKTKAVKNWPRPLALTDIRSFLGLAGYYRRFEDSFACIVSPLTQKKVKFEWSEACERSFQILKNRLTTTPVLSLSEGTKGFVVYCDATRC